VIATERILDLHYIRHWLTQCYGPCETLAHGNKIDNTYWTYDILYNYYIIRLLGDEELNWFKLKYGESI